MFFFDLRDGASATQDNEGHILPDQEAARREALRLLPDLARDEFPRCDRCGFTVDVRNETGAVIFTAKLSLSAHWVS